MAVSKRRIHTDAANRLKMLFSEMGALTYDDVARMVGAPRTSVNNWMAGYALMPVHYAIGLRRKRRDLDLNWLYCGPKVSAEGIFPRGRPVGSGVPASPFLDRRARA